MADEQTEVVERDAVDHLVRCAQVDSKHLAGLADVLGSRLELIEPVKVTADWLEQWFNRYPDDNVDVRVLALLLREMPIEYMIMGLHSLEGRRIVRHTYRAFAADGTELPGEFNEACDVPKEIVDQNGQSVKVYEFISFYQLINGE